MDTDMQFHHWQLCIHGCVDGFSRAIIYLRVNNNRATTVLASFHQSTEEWGHASSIRAENRGENIAVGENITWYRGEPGGRKCCRCVYFIIFIYGGSSIVRF